MREASKVAGGWPIQTLKRRSLLDFDSVEETNITSQGYYTGDLGAPKVSATAKVIHHIDPTITVSTIPDRYRPRHETGEAVFCCVDSISTRNAICGALSHPAASSGATAACWAKSFGS